MLHNVEIKTLCLQVCHFKYRTRTAVAEMSGQSQPHSRSQVLRRQDTSCWFEVNICFLQVYFGRGARLVATGYLDTAIFFLCPGGPLIFGFQQLEVNPEASAATEAELQRISRAIEVVMAGDPRRT